MNIWICAVLLVCCCGVAYGDKLEEVDRDELLREELKRKLIQCRDTGKCGAEQREQKLAAPTCSCMSDCTGIDLDQIKRLFGKLCSDGSKSSDSVTSAAGEGSSISPPIAMILVAALVAIYWF